MGGNFSWWGEGWVGLMGLIGPMRVMEPMGLIGLIGLMGPMRVMRPMRLMGLIGGIRGRWGCAERLFEVEGLLDVVHAVEFFPGEELHFDGLFSS